jgi:hypothetical protein
MFLFRWFERRELGFYGFEFGFMRVVAVSAEEVSSLPSEKISDPFPVNAGFPVSVDISVTFPAEPVTLRKINEFPVKKPEFIPVLCIMAVEAPSHGLGMMEFDAGVLVLEVPFFPVDLHGSMTVTAGKHPLCYGGRRDGKLFRCHGRGNKKECRPNQDHHGGIN